MAGKFRLTPEADSQLGDILGASRLIQAISASDTREDVYHLRHARPPREAPPCG